MVAFSGDIDNISLTLMNDTNIEADETFSVVLTLSNTLPSSVQNRITLQPLTLLFTIIDSDSM